jgi:hypothetical protein
MLFFGIGKRPVACLIELGQKNDVYLNQAIGGQSPVVARDLIGQNPQVQEISGMRKRWQNRSAQLSAAEAIDEGHGDGWGIGWLLVHAGFSWNRQSVF